MALILDFANELINLVENDSFSLVLASSIEKEGSFSEQIWRVQKGTLADDYDYVMHGKVYKCEDTKDKV